MTTPINIDFSLDGLPKDYVFKPSGTTNWNRFVDVSTGSSRGVPLPAGVSKIEITWGGQAAIYVTLPSGQDWQINGSSSVQAPGVPPRTYMRTVMIETATDATLAILAAAPEDANRLLGVVVYPVADME